MPFADTSLQPAAGPYADLIEKYRRQYGDTWEKERAPGLIERIQQACENRDYAYLVGLRFPNEAPFSREVFTRITSIALHQTQRESLRILREFVGAEAVAAYHLEAAKQHEERQVKRLEKRLCLRQVQPPSYGLIPMSDFIQKLIADGYTSLVAQKRGAATEWFLFNNGGSGYVFRRRDEHEYIELMLSRRHRTETPEEPAVEKEGAEHAER
jgi:hypothetical protein